MNSADRHQGENARVNMGLDQSMRVRLEQPVRKQLDAVYTRMKREQLKQKKKAATFAKFVGYCLALGIDQFNARHPAGSKKRP